MTPPIAADAGPRPWWYYAIFAASGFAALIYESLWARYLKVFLGHAAYAQALVLAVFLFGIAVGSILVARAGRISRPMLCYAAAEALLALAAVYFHDIFIAAQHWGLYEILPRIGGDFAAQIFKWMLGAVLILPQAVLLGATFPLLAAGVIRHWPDSPGKTVSALYYANSAGAAVGVLAGGFILVPKIGLVGAGLTGGMLNAAIAVLVWGLARRFGEKTNPLKKVETTATAAPESENDAAKILLLTAAVTGMSSFIYEIVWIRMISMLLGASVYSFEIMLAVFIGGLAAGSFLIRRRIDRITEPLVVLAKVQLAMGALALLSLLLYPEAFKIYAYLWGRLPSGDNIHVYHWLLGGALTAVLVLPAAVCAGMTLPLITRRLMRGRGEASLGLVYGANTLGAIVGVFAAVHWLLPELGVKNAMAVGAFCDLAMGCALFWYARRTAGAAAGSVFTAAAVAVALVFGNVPLHYAAAGIYRTGGILPGEIIFYRDGKTASVAVVKSQKGAPKDGDAEEDGTPPQYTLSIRTNGKSDASLHYGGGYSGDEMTMTMLGLLPLLARPHARRAANIGFGAGLTSLSLLQSPRLERLDNIEIEPAMVDGARRMGEKTAAVFSDSRNRFIFDDAKSVFARAKEPYDIIVSEPSNPWISGIGGLFTREFYRRVKTALAPDGVFVQWMPLYESSPQIFASVVAALGEEFSDFRAYLSASADMIIVATAEGAVPPLSGELFSAAPAARDFFGGYDYTSADNVEALFIGEKRHLAPYFASFHAPVNSDYFPFLEHEAPRAFFRKSLYSWAGAQSLPVPFMEMAGARLPYPRFSAMPRSVMALLGARAQSMLAGLENADGVLRQKISAVREAACIDSDEEEEQYMVSVSNLATELMPFASVAAMHDVWRILAKEPCIAARLSLENDSIAARYTRFWRGVSVRDAAALARDSESLLDVIDPGAVSGQMVMLAAMAAHYKLEDYFRVLALLNQIPPVNPAVHHAARFLGALAAEKI